MIPRPTSSPWIRRYPHDSFSRAIRSTIARTLRCFAGRPGLPWRDDRAQRQRTRSRCQRKIMAGVTISRIPAPHRSRTGDPIGFSWKGTGTGAAKRKSTPEFKEQAAKRVVDNSLPIAQVAWELGINDTTLGFWVKAYRKKLAKEPPPQDMPAHERIHELERRNRELEMENAFLKKAASYFAREQR